MYQNLTPKIKGQVVTSASKHHPMGVNPYSALKRTRKPVKQIRPFKHLPPSKKLSTLLVIVTHWVNSYIRQQPVDNLTHWVRVCPD